MNKDGVVSIGIEYKKEFNQMISDYESALSEMASNKTLSKGMKAQFENVIAELRSFKAEMDKQLSDLSVGKVDVTKFESFKKSVSKKFESINSDISTLNTAVSLLNEKMDMVGNGIDLSKVQNEFKGLEDYINRTNDAVSEFVKKMDGQGIHLFSYDKTNQKEIQSAIKMIDSELKNLDKDYGAKFELFDEKEAQNELDKLATELRSTMELLDSAKSRLSNMDSSSDIFKKTTGEITALELKAARLSDTMEILYDVASEKKLSIDITDDKNLASYDKYIDELSVDLDNVSKSAERAKKELSSLLGDIKSANHVQVSDKLNPNSAQLTAGLTIEADSDELWKKISPVLTGLQGKLNSNPVIAPVKLVVAPTAVSQNNNPDQSISTAYSKKYSKKLAQTGEDAVIDMEGVYKKTYTSIMDEAVKCAEESIAKIQGIFEKAPIDIKLQLSQEELDKINNFVLSNKDEKKIDISGQVDKVNTDVSELNDKLKETTELIQKASQNGSVKFDGIEEFTKQITNSLSSLEKLQDILTTLQNVEITLANTNGLSSITEINNQWESLSKRINNAIKVDGTFRKNANVGKIAEEYQKYLDMGGKNELSSISKLKDNETAIDAITSKMKELSSQKVDTSSIDKAVDSSDKFKSSLDDIISRLDHLISLTKNIGNTFYKMFKDASVSDVDKQWSSIESKFKSIADESGKINLSKQKKDVQELMEMYQKYTNAGGTKTPFDLTDNTETIRKLNKVYEQLNETKTQSKSDNKTISDLSEVDKSVDSLANNLENKLPQASNIAATAMEDSAERQILALASVVDNINLIVKGLKKVKGVEIPEIKIDNGSDKKSAEKVESNISLGDTPAIEQQIKQQDKLQDEIRETIALTNEYGEVIDVYRGTHGLIGNGNVSNRYHGGTFWTSNRKLAAQSYADGNKVTHANLYMRNPYLVHGGGADWDQLVLSIKQGEELEKHLENVYASINDVFSKIQDTSGIEAGHLFDVFDGQLNFTDFENGIQKPIESLKDFQNIFESIDYDNSKIPQVQNYINQLYDLFISYSRISQLSEKGVLNTNEVVEIAKALKYDGVVFNGILDGSDDSSDIFVTFEEKQSKVIDMITAAKLRAEEEQQFANILVNTRENLYKTLKSLDSKQVDEFIDKSAFNFVTDGYYTENLGEVLGKADLTDSIDNIKNKIREYINEVVNEFENAQKQIADSTEPMKDAIQTNNNLATANENVQKAVEGATSAIKENAQVIDNGEMPSIDALIKKANEAAYALTKGKDIVSQTGKRQVYKTTERTDDGKTREGMAGSFSYVERTQAGQLKSIQATFDETTQKWREETTSLVTYFNQVEKAIINADNKINSLENDRDKTLAAHPGYDTSADNALIVSEKNRRAELQKTLDLYTTEKEYVYQIEAANKRIAENQQKLANVSAKKENLRDTISNEKAQLEIDKQLAKEEENLAKAQQKKAQAFLKEQANYEADQKKAEFIKKQTAAYKELTATIGKYSEVTKRVASGKAEDGDLELMTKLEDKISQLQKQPILSDSQVAKSEKSLVSLYDQLDKIERKLVETNQKSQDEQIADFDKQKKLYINKLIGYTDTSKYTSDFVNRASTLQTEIGNLQFTNPQDVARLQEIDSEVIKISNDSKLLENKLVKQQSKLAEIISQMKIFKSQNTKMSGSQKAELDQIINYAETMQKSGKEVASGIEDIKVKFAGLKAEVNGTGRIGKNFFSQIGDRLTDMNSKFVAQFLSWQDWIRYIQQGINTIRDLDEAMTEVRKVSDATEASYAQFQKTIASTAKDIATTNKELLNSSADFLRLGYSLDQASDLAKNATLFVNVGDGVNITEATEDMITAMKAFDIQAEDSIKIVDDYNQIGKIYCLNI